MTIGVRVFLAVSITTVLGCESPSPPQQVVENFFKLRPDMPAAEARRLLGRPLVEAPLRDAAKIDIPQNKRINLADAGRSWQYSVPPSFEGRDTSQASRDHSSTWVYSDATFKIDLMFQDDKLIVASGILDSAAIPDEFKSGKQSTTPKPVPANPSTPREWVTLRGRVALPDGTAVPKPSPVPQNTVKDAAHFPNPLYYDNIIVNSNDRGVRNVVVWLHSDSNDLNAIFSNESINSTRQTPLPVDHVIELTGGQFSPRIVAGRTGDNLILRNHSPLAVDVRCDLTPTHRGTGLKFNVLLPSNSEHSVPASLQAAPMGQLLQSDIYPWMRSWVWAFDHPYFAVTDDHGTFEIPDAPTGEWRLMVWHENIGHKRDAEGKNGVLITVCEGGGGSQVIESVDFDVSAK